MFLSGSSIFIYSLVAIFMAIFLLLILYFIYQSIENKLYRQIQNKESPFLNPDNGKKRLTKTFIQDTSDLTYPFKQTPALRRRSNNSYRVLLILLTLFTLILPISFKYVSENYPFLQKPNDERIAVQTPSATTREPTIVWDVASYDRLAIYLQQNNWEAADRETYELLLKLAGDKSQARGYIDLNEFENLPCSDLIKLDELWREASDGKLGFSAQQIIYKNQGQDWQKMYAEVKWAAFQDESFVLLVDRELNWQTRKLEYKPGMEPNFRNPPPGHLPVTIGTVRGKEFPQFAELCEF